MAELIKSRLSQKTTARVVVFLRREYAKLRRASQNSAKDKEAWAANLKACRKAVNLINDVETGMYDYGLCDGCGKEIALGRLIKSPFSRFCEHCGGGKVVGKERPSKVLILEFLYEERKVLIEDLSQWQGGIKHTLKNSEKSYGKDLGETNIHPKISLAISDQHKAEIIKADELIGEIERDEREYGICDCGEGIPIVRLLLRPFSKHCVECLAEIEQKSIVKISGGGRKRPFVVTAKVLGA